MSEWTDACVEAAKAGYLEGLSCSQIAKKLAGAPYHQKFSRNAVIGKLHRLGITGRQRSSKSVSLRSVRERRAAALPKSKPKPRIVTQSVCGGSPSGLRPPKKDETSIRWLDHEGGKHCEMFCEGEDGALGFVCGKRVEVNRYCGGCARIAYQPTGKIQRQEAA